jgi:HK97 gp10 family phage protein
MSFTDNSGKVKDQVANNVKAALAAMGIEAVGLIVKQMKSGYHDEHQTYDMQDRKIKGAKHTDIRHSSDLMGDVNAEVEGDRVNVGVNKKYAVWVHEGSSRLKGRPFIKDAIMDGKDRLKQVAENELKKGF